MKHILLINSDLAKNRGDRAIAEGNIALVKQFLPNAHITGISQEADRDKEWYGIDFLSMDFQSLNPIDLIRLMNVAKKQDLILWGGGEILKDYTNKAALWYWAGKIWAISLVNKNIIGAYQGIGPTKAESSRKIIAKTVNRCQRFIVRDSESYDKLIAWGADKNKIITASDPAVLPIPEKISGDLKKTLKKDFGITDAFLNDFVCIGPRDWFHYKPGGIIPFKYRKRLSALVGKNTETKDSEEHKFYIKNLEATVDYVANTLGKNILFVPMHMGESDIKLSRKLAKIPKKTKAIVVDKDTLSPAELRSLVGSASIMIGFRLHSNIIGVSAGTPSLNIYYVDKGRVFFDQIKQSKFAIPIESLLEDTYSELLKEKITALLKDKEKVEKEIKTQTERLRTSVKDAFHEAISPFV